MAMEGVGASDALPAGSVGQGAAAAHPAVPAAPERHVVIFQLGRELYGVAIQAVREIIPWQAVTPVPGAAPYVEGVINLRGRVLPVLDVRPRFGIAKEPPGRSTRIVVVELGAELAGIVVDAVTEVLRIPAELVDAEVMQGDGSPFLEGVARLEGRLVILLSLDRLLPALNA